MNKNTENFQKNEEIIKSIFFYMKNNMNLNSFINDLESFINSIDINNPTFFEKFENELLTLELVKAQISEIESDKALKLIKDSCEKLLDELKDLLWFFYLIELKSLKHYIFLYKKNQIDLIEFVSKANECLDSMKYIDTSWKDAFIEMLDYVCVNEKNKNEHDFYLDAMNKILNNIQTDILMFSD